MNLLMWHLRELEALHKRQLEEPVSTPGGIARVEAKIEEAKAGLREEGPDA